MRSTLKHKVVPTGDLIRHASSLCHLPRSVIQPSFVIFPASDRPVPRELAFTCLATLRCILFSYYIHIYIYINYFYISWTSPLLFTLFSFVRHFCFRTKQSFLYNYGVCFRLHDPFKYILLHTFSQRYSSFTEYVSIRLKIRNCRIFKLVADHEEFEGKQVNDCIDGKEQAGKSQENVLAKRRRDTDTKQFSVWTQNEIAN